MSEPFAQPINARTRYCAVYGHPIHHSASPAMQNAGIAKLGLDWRYLAFEVHPDDLRAAIAGAQAMKFIGLNLTVPHKVLAVDIVDAVDAEAKRYGAVNTVRFEVRLPSGEWRPLAQWDGGDVSQIRSQGFNTDAEGFALSLREEFPNLTLAGASVVLIGTGGAGRTVALRMAQAGVKAMWLIDVDAGRVEQLVRELGEAAPGTSVKIGYPDKSQRADLLVNATPLGLKPADPLPLDQGRWLVSNAAFVYDLIYQPAETALLQAAKAAGCRAANGIGMLLYQGAKALEIWSGQTAPVAEMRRALVAQVYGAGRP
jgi:shikimate dehydrogenase